MEPFVHPNAEGSKEIESIEDLQIEIEALQNTKNELQKRIKEQENEIRILNTQLQESLVRENELHRDIMQYENEINTFYASSSWKITAPLRALRKGGAWLVDHVSVFHKIYMLIKILRLGGIRYLIHEMKHYGEYQEQKKRPKTKTEERDIYTDSEYQENEKYTDCFTDVKMLAFYLPQYHSFPENDEWWGKGFTEWVNVKSGSVRFDGHYQPRVPHSDIGYYDLNNIEVLAQQARLAKEHGIYGFTFYYYWFSGKRLMEKPVDMLLQHPEIDLPFCLCWANENWTRTWDGQDKNVLIAQAYSDHDDDQFMVDLKKYIDDKRYIRINGKPLVIVYNPGQIPDCKKSFARWRDVAREIGIGEILIWTCQTANNTAEKLEIEDYVDAEVEFPPHNMWMPMAEVNDVDLHGSEAYLYSYPKIVDEMVAKLKKTNRNKLPLHHGCMLAWDNAARRKNGWFTFCGFSLRKLYTWVTEIAEQARKDFDEEERFVFINAWNEWGEGTYLEPDEKYGYASINTVSKALFGLPFDNDIEIIGLKSSAVEKEKFDKNVNESRIAIQAHIFYPDILTEIIQYLNDIPYRFDCYFSTETEEKKKEIEKLSEGLLKAGNFLVEVFPNRGRDVAPFLLQMKDRLDQYDYICHIHTKKTLTNDHGDEWRSYIFDHLFGNEDYLKRVFALFENNPQIGLLMPATYPVLELQAEWGGNKDGVRSLLHKMGIETELPHDPVFPVGDMFWARTEAIKKLFSLGLTSEDFPKEEGQINATIAHQIERTWIYLIEDQGYIYKKIFNCINEIPELRKKKRIMLYAHYDKRNVVTKDDIETLASFSQICDDVVCVSNSELSEVELEKLRPYTKEIILRENKGLDFGAWKEALLSRKEEIVGYDELILLNNSCFAPLFDLRIVFGRMEEKNIDFWGNTVFPYSSDGSYIGKECIDEHIQSYFMGFNSPVIQSDIFWNFWEQLPIYEKFIDVVANCESRFTQILSDGGFTYEPYIRESYYISKFLNNYAIPYEKPSSLVLLKDPFVKKKCYLYMDGVEKIKLEYLLEELKAN